MWTVLFMVWFLSQLHTDVVQVGLLLEVAITSNPKSMRQYIPTLLPTLLPLLQSPLTASVVTPVILKLGKSALDDEQKYLGEHCFMLWLNFILGLSFRCLCGGGMVVYDNDLETKDNRDWTKDEIESHHKHCILLLFDLWFFSFLCALGQPRGAFFFARQSCIPPIGELTRRL